MERVIEKIGGQEGFERIKRKLIAHLKWTSDSMYVEELAYEVLHVMNRQDKSEQEAVRQVVRNELQLQKETAKKQIGEDADMKKEETQTFDSFDSFNCLAKLQRCFPGSFTNERGEFIAHKKSNAYFNLAACASELDVKCKVLEYLSYYADKGIPYASDQRNKAFRKDMLRGINEFLGTVFTEDDIEIVYTYIGNGIRHGMTERFVESGYDMNIISPAYYGKRLAVDEKERAEVPEYES